MVERLVAHMAIVTGDSRLKKFSTGLRQKASAEKNGPFAQQSRNTSPYHAPIPSINAKRPATLRRHPKVILHVTPPVNVPSYGVPCEYPR